MRAFIRAWPWQHESVAWPPARGSSLLRPHPGASDDLQELFRANSVWFDRIPVPASRKDVGYRKIHSQDKPVTYGVRSTEEAEADLLRLYDFILTKDDRFGARSKSSA
jgi:hypothetical protein